MFEKLEENKLINVCGGKLPRNRFYTPDRLDHRFKPYRPNHNNNITDGKYIQYDYAAILFHWDICAPDGTVLSSHITKPKGYTPKANYVDQRLLSSAFRVPTRS